MSSDGKSEVKGKIPLIEQYEILHDQYESHKDNVRSLKLFREAQTALILKNKLRMERLGMMNSQEYARNQFLVLKYVDKGFLNESKVTCESPKRIKRRSSKIIKQDYSKSLTRFYLKDVPSAEEINQVDEREDFSQFYKRITPTHLQTINVKKEMDKFVFKKLRAKKSILNRNSLAGKPTENSVLREHQQTQKVRSLSESCKY